MGSPPNVEHKHPQERKKELHCEQRHYIMSLRSACKNFKLFALLLLEMESAEKKRICEHLKYISIKTKHSYTFLHLLLLLLS